MLIKDLLVVRRHNIIEQLKNISHSVEKLGSTKGKRNKKKVMCVVPTPENSTASYAHKTESNPVWLELRAFWLRMIHQSEE